MTTTPANTPQPTAYVVKMAVALPMSRQEFNGSVQITFKQSVARAAGVSSADVSIDSILDMDGDSVRRRLLTAGIRVDTSVQAPNETTAIAISTSLTPSSLNTALVSAGLPAATILEAPAFAVARQASTPRISTETVTVTPPPESVSEPTPDLMLVVGVVLGALGSAVLILGSYLLWLKHRT